MAFSICCEVVPIEPTGPLALSWLEARGVAKVLLRVVPVMTLFALDWSGLTIPAALDEVRLLSLLDLAALEMLSTSVDEKYPRSSSSGDKGMVRVESCLGNEAASALGVWL